MADNEGFKSRFYDNWDRAHPSVSSRAIKTQAIITHYINKLTDQPYEPINSHLPKSELTVSDTGIRDNLDQITDGSYILLRQNKRMVSYEDLFDKLHEYHVTPRGMINNNRKDFKIHQSAETMYKHFNNCHGISKDTCKNLVDACRDCTPLKVDVPVVHQPAPDASLLTAQVQELTAANATVTSANAILIEENATLTAANHTLTAENAALERRLFDAYTLHKELHDQLAMNVNDLETPASTTVTFKQGIINTMILYMYIYTSIALTRHFFIT